MKMQSTTRLLSIALATILLTGCHSAGSKIPVEPQQFPADIKQTQVLDVQVIKHASEVQFTNTSTRAFGPSTIWLNKRFHHKIDSIGVGQTVILPLKEFTDEFGDAFRGGGFWATEDPETLVLTQIETTNADGKTELIGLITIRADE